MLTIVPSGRFAHWRSLRRALQAEERPFTVVNADGDEGMETGLVWLRPRRDRHERGAGDGAVEDTDLPEDLQRDDSNQ